MWIILTVLVVLFLSVDIIFRIIEIIIKKKIKENECNNYLNDVVGDDEYICKNKLS